MFKSLQLSSLILALGLTCLAGQAQASLYSSAVLADNPVAYYRFEDAGSTNGSTAANSASTGSAIDGTYTGSGLNLLANGYHANLGNAVDVSTGSYVLATNNAALDLTTGATLEAWINTTFTNTFARVISKERTEAYQLYFNNNTGRIGVENSLTGGGHTLFTPNSILNTSWRHVVATFDSSVGWKIYLDGNEVASDSNTTLIGTNSDPLNLFRDANGGDFFTGQADEIAIYNYALSEARIDAHYEAASAVPEPSSFVLAGLGLVGLAGYVVRRRR